MFHAAYGNVFNLGRLDFHPAGGGEYSSYDRRLYSQRKKDQSGGHVHKLTTLDRIQHNSRFLGRHPR